MRTQRSNNFRADYLGATGNSVHFRRIGPLNFLVSDARSGGTPLFSFFLLKNYRRRKKIYCVNIREKHPFPHVVPFPSQIIRFFIFFFHYFFLHPHIFSFFYSLGENSSSWIRVRDFLFDL